MADVKISELPAASTPLAGTEQIPLVQDATTKQITVSNLLTSANLGTPSAINLANATNVPMDEASGVLAVANGGSGTATPALVAGTNVTISGSWPNQTINSTYSGAVTSVTGTAPVVSSGGTTPAISMAAATGSVNGYLTSTDWTTFNNKLTSGGPLGTPSSGTATNLTGLPLSTGVTGLLPVANGGTGTATPNLVAGSNVTISGTWPNQTIAAAGAAQVYPSAGIANSTGSAWGTSYSTTGSGTVVALATSPTFVTPALGVPASGDFSSGTFTWPTFNQNTTGTAAGLSATLAVASGGTGQTSYTDGQLLIGNSTGNTLTKATLTAGANITITNSAGGITIAAAGGGGSGTVTSVSGTGTVNGLTLTGTVTTSGSLTLGGTLDLSSPPAIGGTAAAAGAFTTLSASSTVTLSGGTANGVTYLNGSKVLTSGSALTFDGTDVGIGGAPVTGLAIRLLRTSGSAEIRYQNTAATWDSGVLAAGDFEIFTAANKSIQFGVNSSEQMRLTSTGLGIGTSSPNAKLDVVGGGFRVHGYTSNSGSDGYNIQIGVTGNVGYIQSLNNTTPNSLSLDGSSTLFRGYNGSSFVDRMLLDTAGNLGLGVTPSAWGSSGNMDFTGGPGIGLGTTSGAITMNAYYNSGWKYKTTNSASYYYQVLGQHQWFTAASGTAGNAISFTQAATLDASGNFLVGFTSPVNSSKILSVASSGNPFVAWNTATSGNNGFISFGTEGSYSERGYIYYNRAAGLTQLSATSDYRAKEFDGETQGALQKVVSMRVVNGKLKWADGSFYPMFIAHELQEVAPWAVTGEKDAIDDNGNPKYQSVSYESLVATLTAAIKELKAEFDTYKAAHP